MAQGLTKEYGLKAAEKKDLALTHQESLQPAEAKRYYIFQAVTDCLEKSKDLTDLEVKLLKRRIDTQYKYNEQTREPEGISFRFGKQCYKGSQIDREFSLKGLETHFEAKQQALDQEREEQDLSHSHSRRISR